MDEISREKFMDEVIKFSRDQNNIALYMKLPREELERNTYIAEAKAEGYELGYEEGYPEGYQEGYQEGLQEWKLKVVQRLKENGMSVDEIVKVVKIPKEEIKNL